MEDLRYQVDMLTAMNNTYEANERIYKMILENTGHLFIFYQPSTKTVRTFGNWSDYFDIVPVEYSDLIKLLDMLSEEERDKVRFLFFPDSYEINENSIVAKHIDGKRFIEIESHIKRDETGNVEGYLIVLSDVTKKQLLNNELSFMAYYDFVTGLFNRNYFVQKLKEFLEKAENEKTIVAIMMIDIDDFHKINDGIGIIYGDEVIQNFGIYLRGLCRDNVIGARFDGDIYSIAIYSPAGNSEVEAIYNEIKERLREPFLLTNGSSVTFSVSVGVSEYPEAGTDALELINGAEIVMLKAKDAGKNAIKYFDSDILNEFKTSFTIENKLKLAVNGLSFYLNFQPIYKAYDQKLRGVEALIRWKDDEGKLIPPDVFIPIAERNGSITLIGDWVLEQSIKTFMEWKKKFDSDLIMSVNISSIQYKRPEFVNKVISTINKYGMKPEELELEITESLLIDDIQSVYDKMDELRDFGVRMSIDDFGTGFSSLSYLKHLPADTIKIDRSFIDTISTDTSTRVIIESIIEMAQRLGYDTVAEGVETEEQLEYLKKAGCDYIQGYYLSKPISCEAFEEILLRLI